MLWPLTHSFCYICSRCWRMIYCTQPRYCHNYTTMAKNINLWVFGLRYWTTPVHAIITSSEMVKIGSPSKANVYSHGCEQGIYNHRHHLALLRIVDPSAPSATNTNPINSSTSKRYLLVYHHFYVPYDPNSFMIDNFMLLWVTDVLLHHLHDQYLLQLLLLLIVLQHHHHHPCRGRYQWLYRLFYCHHPWLNWYE